LEAVVRGAHEDVVHVEEDAAVGAGRDRAQECPLGHRRVREGDVARDVLQQDATPEGVLDLPHAIDDVRQRLVGVRQRQKVVGIVTADASPAEVIGDPGGFHAFRKSGQIIEVVRAQRVDRAE
jgi:hypothetical protein